MSTVKTMANLVRVRIVLMLGTAGLFLLSAALTYGQGNTQWQAFMGAESKDQASQVMAFLPNELWIHPGDSITWSTRTHEIHTVTFLKPDQVRPSRRTGCPGTTASGSNYDGSECVNSGTFNIAEPGMPAGPTTYTVRFPRAGNFKLVCLVHRDMTGVVHVLPPSETLPYDQLGYGGLAADQTRDLINATGQAVGRNPSPGTLTNEVVTTGELVATGGGKQFLAIVRFLPETISVHVGETVEWTNLHPTEPHTVTFGKEPENPRTLVGLDAPDSDGALRGTLPNATPDRMTLSSGFLEATLQDQTMLTQTAPGVTRVRVTFTQAGTFDYICAIHDELGMKGKVVVVP